MYCDVGAIYLNIACDVCLFQKHVFPRNVCFSCVGYDLSVYLIHPNIIVSSRCPDNILKCSYDISRAFTSADVFETVYLP